MAEQGTAGERMQYLGRSDFIRVPLPAARITTFRGTLMRTGLPAEKPA